MVGWYKSDNLPGYCSGHASAPSEETTSTSDANNNNQGGTPDNGGGNVVIPEPVVPDIPPYPVIPEYN